MRLAYTAFDQSGKQVANTIDAPSVADATEQLRKRGLFVAKIAADRDAAAAPRKRRGGGGGRRLKNLAGFTRQLFVLLSTGTPVVDALAAVERQTRDKSWQATVKELRKHVEEGEPLSEAMAKLDRAFDPVFRSVIAAGESAGKLPEVLERLNTLVRKQQHIRSSVIGAMIYPSLLICVAMSVLVLMLTFVLPRFTGMFETLDVPLPTSTVALMWISELLRGYWWALLPGTALMVAGLVWWQKSDHGRQVRDTVLIHTPFIGALLRNFHSARIARLLGMLLSSFLPMLEVLGHVKAGMSNDYYRKLIKNAEERLTRGQTISDAFANERLINPSVYEAIKNGEQTGQIAALSLTIADFLDEENDVVVKSLTSILEPVILIVMGLLVGFVAVSMFLPLFDLSAMAGR